MESLYGSQRFFMEPYTIYTHKQVLFYFSVKFTSNFWVKGVSIPFFFFFFQCILIFKSVEYYNQANQSKITANIKLIQYNLPYLHLSVWNAESESWNTIANKNLSLLWFIYRSEVIVSVPISSSCTTIGILLIREQLLIIWGYIQPDLNSCFETYYTPSICPQSW